MMGTSLLAMPWALQQAGLVLGIFLILLTGLISFYTAYRVIKSPNGLGSIFINYNVNLIFFLLLFLNF